MNRLTYKEKWRDEFGNEHLYDSEDNYCIEKLGKLEDLEEELGINLELYINTHLKGVYVKGMEPLWSGGQKNEIIHYAVVSFTKDYLEVCYANSHDIHCLWKPLEEYGKTWSLDKQTLEK